LGISPDEDKNLAKLYLDSIKEGLSQSLDINSIFPFFDIEIITHKEEI
jgi:hypothetical protein